jgi:hypothetical protein
MTEDHHSGDICIYTKFISRYGKFMSSRYIVSRIELMQGRKDIVELCTINNILSNKNHYLIKDVYPKAIKLPQEKAYPGIGTISELYKA